MRRFLIAAGLALSAAGTAAGGEGIVAAECDWMSSMTTIIEPWEENSRTFYDGRVRVVAIDTVEPACCWAHLVLLLPPPEREMEYRQCVVVNQGGGMGFAGLRFDELAASYDPKTGLTISFPYALYDPETGGTRPWRSGQVRINLATGEVMAR